MSQPHGEAPRTPEGPTEQDLGPRLQNAPTEESVPAPIAAVRDDVGRVAAFFRSIHSRTLWLGIAFYLATFATGVLLALFAPLRDWFMHAAMYLVIFCFLMIYVRAHQLGRRVGRAFYAIVTLLLIGFFCWVLIDLIPDRLDVVDGPVTQADGSVIEGPAVVPRGDVPILIVPVVMLAISGVWLAFHWLVISRYGREA